MQVQVSMQPLVSRKSDGQDVRLLIAGLLSDLTDGQYLASGQSDRTFKVRPSLWADAQTCLTMLTLLVLFLTLALGRLMNVTSSFLPCGSLDCLTKV